MTTGPTIRPATDADAEAIATLFTDEGYPAGPSDIRERLSRFDSTFSTVRVAELGGDVVGFVAVHVMPRFEHGDRIARILALIVDAGVRERGIGHILMSTAEEVARETGCAFIEITAGATVPTLSVSTRRSATRRASPPTCASASRHASDTGPRRHVRGLARRLVVWFAHGVPQGDPRDRRPRGHGLEPRQGLLPAGRAHQARRRALLPGRRRRRPGRCPRPADGAQALRRRHRPRAVLPEARSGESPVMDAHGDTDLSVGPHGRRDRRRRGSGSGLGRQPGLRRPQPAPGPRRRPGPPRRAAGRPRSGARECRTRRCARSPLVIREALDAVGLVGWPKTSGSRGIHVNVRIEPRWTYPQVRRAALALARDVERRAPSIATSKWWKEERHGVFLDYNQNAKDRTVASAYSVRPTPDARVSAPLTWDEVPDCRTRRFHAPERAGAVRQHRRPRRRHRRCRGLARRAARAVRSRTRRRGWAMRPGPPTTPSRPASRRACSRRASDAPTADYEGRGVDGGPPPEVAAERAAAVASGDPNAGLPTEWPGAGAARGADPGRALGRPRPADARAPCRSSRSRARRPRPTPWPAWIDGRRAIRRSCRSSSRPTSWSMACAAARRSGIGCASTSSTCPRRIARARKPSIPTTTR